MTDDSSCVRPRSTRREVLLLVCIGTLVFSLVICSILNVRDMNKRQECKNNLRQLGLAFHTYHDSHNGFPTENGPEEWSFYFVVIDTIGDQVPRSRSVNKEFGIESRTPDGWLVPLFLCPARRTPQMAPRRRDYGYAATNGTGSAGKSILDAPGGYSAHGLAALGLTQTLLLSHVWMDPNTYAGADPTDLGWATKNNSRTINDTAKPDDDPTGSIQHIGGPHRKSLPSLFADAHVSDIPYDYPHWAELWAYDKRKPIRLPE